MKTKHLFIASSLCITLLSNCGNSTSINEDQNNASIPVELKDTTILQADEENALEKLNNVIDTSQNVK